MGFDDVSATLGEWKLETESRLGCRLRFRNVYLKMYIKKKFF